MNNTLSFLNPLVPYYPYIYLGLGLVILIVILVMLARLAALGKAMQAKSDQVQTISAKSLNMSNGYKKIGNHLLGIGKILAVFTLTKNFLKKKPEEKKEWVKTGMQAAKTFQSISGLMK